MDNKLTVSIRDFSVTPGSRYRDEGEFSGQEFREKVLEKKFEEARTLGKKLVVNLDGTMGFGTSFLEEVFGGLARKYTPSKVLELLELVSTEEPYLVDDVLGYVKKATY